jgi:hypothetical protein
VLRELADRTAFKTLRREHGYGSLKGLSLTG